MRRGSVQEAGHLTDSDLDRILAPWQGKEREKLPGRAGLETRQSVPLTSDLAGLWAR